MILDQNAPTGEELRVGDKIYHFEPRTLSGKVIRAVQQRLKAKHNEMVIASINELNQLKSVLGAEAYTQASLEVAKEISQGYRPTTNEAVAAMGELDVLPLVLFHISPDLGSEEEAIRLVDEYPDYQKLIDIAEACTGRLEAKNSESPGDKVNGAEERTSKSQSTNPEPRSPSVTAGH